MVQKQHNQECLGFFEMACAGICNSEKRCDGQPRPSATERLLQPPVVKLELLRAMLVYRAGLCRCTTSASPEKPMLLRRTLQVMGGVLLLVSRYN
jgi:hypothetical protein